jgi:hypothetical protein
MKIHKLLPIFLVSVLISSLGIVINPVAAQSATVKVDPALTEYYLNAVGKEFTVAVKITDVTNLYGFDLKLRWNTTVLEYVSHSVKVPRNTYPDGVLWDPTLQAANTVNETAGTYWIAYSSMNPAPAFNGSGTAFTMTFRVKYHPVQPSPDANVTLELYDAQLAAFGGGQITPITKENGTVLLHALPPISTILYVTNNGNRYFRKSQGVVFTVDVGIQNVTDLYGFAISLEYNTTLLDVISVAEGSFLNSHGDTYVVKNYMNDTEGQVRYALSLLGTSSGAEGDGTLFTVTLRASTTVLGTSNLVLNNTDLGDYNGNSIDHSIMDGSVTILEVEVINWNIDGYTFATASSSVITNFAYNDSAKIVSFDVNGTGLEDIPGYTDLTVPKAAMNLSSNDMFIVLFNGTALSHTRSQNETHYFLYFTYSHGSIFVAEVKQTLIGDLNGDREVDMVDVVIVCVAFDSQTGDSYYNPVADLKPTNGDGKINIYDVILVTHNYDKTWTPP